MTLLMRNECRYVAHTFDVTEIQKFCTPGIWLTGAVHHSIPWTCEDVVVCYDGDDFLLRGLKSIGDRSLDACVSMRLSDRAELKEALHKLYRFTSVLGWFHSGYVDVVGHVVGSHPTRYAVGRQPFSAVLWGRPHRFNCNFMPVVSAENTRRALAFWREGVKLRKVHAGFSFLSFFKVLESQFAKKSQRVDWMNAAFPALTDEAAQRINQIALTESDVGKYIFESGRCAIAHASFGENFVDPDIPGDRERIQKDLPVVEALARKFIADELGVPQATTVDDCRHALAATRDYLSPILFRELENGRSILRKTLSLNGLEVTVNEWSYAPLEGWCSMKVEVAAAHNGVVDLRLYNRSKSLSLAFVFDFPNNRAVPNLRHCYAKTSTSRGHAEDEIAYLQFQKAVIGNAQMELLFPNGEKVVCDDVLPVNIDVGAAFASIEGRIAALRSTTSIHDESGSVG